MLPDAQKDVLPANQRSSVIYEYVCHCDSRYASRTTQSRQERIKQHVPKAIKQQTTLLSRREPTDTNQPEHNQIENAKQIVRLNSNQRAIHALAIICWNPISALTTILICGLKF